MYSQLEEALFEMDFIEARKIANRETLFNDYQPGKKTLATVIGKSKELNEALASNNHNAHEFLTSMVTKRFATFPILQVELFNTADTEKNYNITQHIIKISHENLQQVYPQRWQELYKVLDGHVDYTPAEMAIIQSFNKPDETPQPSCCTIS